MIKQQGRTSSCGSKETGLRLGLMVNMKGPESYVSAFVLKSPFLLGGKDDELKTFSCSEEFHSPCVGKLKQIMYGRYRVDSPQVVQQWKVLKLRTELGANWIVCCSLKLSSKRWS